MKTEQPVFHPPRPERMAPHYTLRDASGVDREITPDWFLRKVEKTPTCWLWKGTTSVTGKTWYGRVLLINRGDGRRSFTMAHRVAWQLWCGPLPPRLHVCHTCDNGLCVNPDHLFLGTHADNMHDRDKKGRGRNGGIAKRPNFTRALITPLAVKKIRKLRSEGLQIKEIAQRLFYHAVRGVVGHRAWNKKTVTPT